MYKLFFGLRNESVKLILLALGAVPGAIVCFRLNNSLLVNIFGAACLGLLMGLRCRNSFNLLLGIGFCGSLTTFSGWMLECYKLIAKGAFIHSFKLIFLVLFLGLIALAIGLYLGSFIRNSMLSQ